MGVADRRRAFRRWARVASSPLPSRKPPPALVFQLTNSAVWSLTVECRSRARLMGVLCLTLTSYAPHSKICRTLARRRGIHGRTWRETQISSCVPRPYRDLAILFRRNGIRTKLPGFFGSREFLDASAAALGEQSAEPAERETTLPESFRALATRYFASPQFLSLSAISQTNYRRAIDRFLLEHGRRRVDHRYGHYDEHKSHGWSPSQIPRANRRRSALQRPTPARKQNTRMRELTPRRNHEQPMRDCISPDLLSIDTKLRAGSPRLAMLQAPTLR
jgi:hypothetical protein